MSLAKAVVSGLIYRAPEKRYTQNDVAVYSFTLSVDAKEDTLIRVIARRKALAEVLDKTKKGDRVLVEGRLQVGTSKAQDGTDRKYFELDANWIELLSGNISIPTASVAENIEAPKQDIVTFAETDYSENSLIDEDEIPF